MLWAGGALIPRPGGAALEAAAPLPLPGELPGAQLRLVHVYEEHDGGAGEDGEPGEVVAGARAQARIQVPRHWHLGWCGEHCCALVRCSLLRLGLVWCFTPRKMGSPWDICRKPQARAKLRARTWAGIARWAGFPGSADFQM